MKNKIFIVFGTAFIGVLLSFFYGQTTVSNPQEKFIGYREMIGLTEGRLKVSFYLPRDAYLLKLKHVIREKQTKDVFVNGFQISPDLYQYISRRGVIETDYIRLPNGIIETGQNVIEIHFLNGSPQDVDIRISNYWKQIDNDIYFLFPDSYNLPPGKIYFKAIFSIMIFIFLFFLAGIYFLSRILSLSLNRLFLYEIYSSVPFLIFLFSLRIFSNLSQLYRIVIRPSYFWTFGIASFLVAGSSLILMSFWRSFINNEFIIINPRVYDFTTKLLHRFKEKEFSDKCILFFVMFIMPCAFLLILHLELIAKKIVHIAYSFLVIGTVIKFIKFVKEEESK